MIDFSIKNCEERWCIEKNGLNILKRLIIVISTIQECQQALLKGEFVMEEKQATFSSNSKSGTEEAISLPNQMTGQLPLCIAACLC